MPKHSLPDTTQLQRETLYAELCRSFKRGYRRDPPLFLSSEEYRHVKDEFVARDVGRHLRRLHLRQTPPRLSKPSLSLDAFVALDATDELRALLNPIFRWQGQAAFAVKRDQYEKAEAELKRLAKELRRIANALVPPKPRFSKLKGDLDFFKFYAERFFFWTLLHGEYQVLRRDRWKRNSGLALSELKQHYAYLDLPSNLNTTTLEKDSPLNNTYADIAARFNAAVDSIPPRINEWLGPRTQSRLKK